MSGQADLAKAAIRRDIIFGRRLPGSRLIESELADQFDLGRHIVRSVLADLERMGLVQRRPNRGVIVIDYDPDEVEHLYEMREILQREAVLRLALPVPRASIAALTTFNAAYLTHLRAGDLDRVVEANNAFHRTLFGLCGNRFLAQSIEDHWQKSAAIHSYAIAAPAMAEASHRQHQAMIDMLVAQDRGRLADLCTQHMQPALRAYQAAHGGWGLASPAAG